MSFAKGQLVLDIMEESSKA